MFAVCTRDGKRWFARPVKEKKDVSWRDQLSNFVLKCVETNKTPSIVIPVGDELPKVRSKSEKPVKADAIAKHQSRFAS